MSWVAVAIGGSAVAGGIANYFGQSSAANTAANAETNAANQTNATNMSMFNTEQQNAKPYLQAGDSALNSINQNQGYYNTPFSMSQFQEDPGYQFDLQQGQQAIQNSSVATNGLISGSELGALNNYSQNMASNEYGNAYNRYTQQQQSNFNRYATIAGLGEQATGLSNQAAQTAATNIGAGYSSAGNAVAAGAIAQGNATTGLIGSGVNAASTYGTLSMLNGRGGGGYNPTANWNPAQLNPQTQTLGNLSGVGQ